MDTIRHQVEASLTRTRGAIMEDRYRRLHHEQAIHQYWTQPPTQAMAMNRFKRHLPAIPKKKSKDSTKKSDHFDVPQHVKHYKDKYGSVSAHSTSAIYGALRAPHYHAVYGAADMWYASVRSLNRGCHRDVVYSAEAYEWRETLYEDVPKEAYALPPPMEMIPRPPLCECMVQRRRPSRDRPSSQGKSSRHHHPRCKYCTSAIPKNGAPNGIPSNTKRTMVAPDKLKPAITAENNDNKHEATSRMSGYKKCVPGASKYSLAYSKGASTKDPGVISRKSILECDVTAYDLIKKVSKTPSVTEIDDSDVDDNLSDNAIARMNQSRLLRFQSKCKVSSPNGGTPRQIANKKFSSKVKKSQSENCIYNDSHSVLVGGQRIFTDNHRPKSPDILFNRDSSEVGLHHAEDASSARWRRMSASEESVCIPAPDYDFSDESDDETVINANLMDPKFTYSPPPIRKSYDDLRPNLGQNSRELSKSMSSLLSDDTYVPSINLNNCDRSYTPDIAAEQHDCDNELFGEENFPISNGSHKNLYDDEDDYAPSTSNGRQMQSLKQESKYESSSDCSSSGGTLSSDYPTWTSSSSNELKSILKKKKRRESAIQELEDTNRIEREKLDAKEAQRKKQVQFRPGWEKSIRADDIGDDAYDSDTRDIDENTNYADSNSTVINDTYETIAEASNERNCSTKSQDILKTNGEAEIGLNSVQCNAQVGASRSKPTSANRNHSNGPEDDIQPSLPLNLANKLTPGLSSSLEDVRGVHQGSLEVKKKSSRSRRPTTLPKRRFSDMHLHILLCPTRASFCGNGGSSDDMPLTVSTQRAHRSLPESPSEIDEVPSFCFDFLEKSSREKVVSSSRSVFYVPVDGGAKNEESKEGNSSTANSTKEEKGSPLVLPSVSANSNETRSREQSEVVEETNESLSPEQYDTDEDVLENDYENLDPIYEELSDISNSSKRMVSLESNQKSFFEGASKTDILSYLEDAKERGLSEGLSEDEKVIVEEEEEDEKVLSAEEEDVGEKNRVIANNSLNHKEVLLKIEEVSEKDEEQETVESDVTKNSRISEVERNDSGVGTETSKPSRMKVLPEDWEEQLCADCDNQVEPIEEESSGLLFSPLVCRKCEFRRSERKEIIIEFVDTELKYGRDLRIITEEFYRPMEIAGLLAKDQLLSIFLNLEELVAVNTIFSEKLQDALDIAMEHGDEDYTTVNIGKIFLETSNMLHAFETYCVKQASASVLLSHLEKEKELLRIFLRVSQMENTLLRRMNLPAFLMVPVQRVTRYPLLLSRLHKVTPIHHKDRNAVKEAQQKVELHLEHINQQTKGVGGTKIWRRISNISASHRRLGKDIGSIKLRKMALEILNWKQDEARFVMAGKLLFTQITDYPWNKKGKTIKFAPLHALLIALGKPNSNYRPESTADNPVLFPRNTGIRDASLVLMKEKNGRFIVVREPLYLGNCVISCESENDDVFEIQEYTTKEAYLLKGESKKETKEWLRQLRYHAKDLGSWRKRRNALANIMINGMIRQ